MSLNEPGRQSRDSILIDSFEEVTRGRDWHSSLVDKNLVLDALGSHVGAVRVQKMAGLALVSLTAHRCTRGPQGRPIKLRMFPGKSQSALRGAGIVSPRR